MLLSTFHVELLCVLALLTCRLSWCLPSSWVQTESSLFVVGRDMWRFSCFFCSCKTESGAFIPKSHLVCYFSCEESWKWLFSTEYFKSFVNISCVSSCQYYSAESPPCNSLMAPCHWQALQIYRPVHEPQRTPMHAACHQQAARRRQLQHWNTHKFKWKLMPMHARTQGRMLDRQADVFLFECQLEQEIDFITHLAVNSFDLLKSGQLGSPKVILWAHR